MTKKRLKILCAALIAILFFTIGAYVAYSYFISDKFNPDVSNVAEVKTNEIDFSDKAENTNENDPDNTESANSLTEDKTNSGFADNDSGRGVYIDSRSDRFLVSRDGSASSISGINGIINGIVQIPSNNANQNTNNSGGSDSNSTSGGVSTDGDNNVIFPALGSLKEPAKSNPDDAYDSLGIPILDYRANDPDNNARLMTLEVSLAYEDMFDNKEISIYEGELLTQQNILCRVYAYAVEDGNYYRIRELSNNFYIKDFPQRAYNNFKATFCFRTTPMSEWQEITLTIPTVPRKLLLVTYQDGLYANATDKYSDLYPKFNECLNLYKYYYILGENNTEINRLFRGWSETENGKPIGEEYTVTKDGLIYLYPTGFTSVPSGMKAQIKARMFGKNLEYLQTLTACDSKISKLDVPKYITFIQFSEQSSFDEVNLSSTVKYIDFYNANDQRTLRVKNRYTVDESNPYFTVAGRILLSKDESIVYDIPSSVKSATIPNTVKQINLSEYNSELKELRLSSKEVPSINLSCVSDVTIYVPREYYFDYLNALGSSLGTNRLMPNDNSLPEYIFANGAILSDYGKTLYSVDKNAIGTVIVPSSVENVASGATENNPNIDTIIFDKNLKHLEANAINTDCIKRVFILSDNATDIESESFSSASGGERDFSELSVFVQQSAYDGSLKSYTQLLGEDNAKAILCSDNLAFENENGFSLLSTQSGSIILNAPKDLKKFDSHDLSKPVIEIGPCAFKGSESLRYVNLSSSVKTVSVQSFAECKALEGIYSGSRDSITVKSKALYNDTGLKYGVFNALYGNFDEDFQNINVQLFFAPYNTYGYGSDRMVDYFAYFVDYDSSGYDIVEVGDDERIVYAWCDFISSTGPGYVVCAATTGINGKITLPDNTRMIQDYAFANCSNKFELENYDALELVSSYSFANSGLSGDYDFTNLHFILEGGFSGCKYLKSVKFPAIKMASNIVMSGCSSLEEVEFGDEFEALCYGSFSGCDKLKTITFSSKEPIELEGAFGADFKFADEESPDEASFKIKLVGQANAEEYIKQWRCTILGWPLEFIDMISNEELDRGEIIARKHLGIYDASGDDAQAYDTTSQG